MRKKEGGKREGNTGVPKSYFDSSNGVEGNKLRLPASFNKETNETHRYKSINECLRAIGHYAGSTSGIIKNYIKPGKVFKAKYVITYIIN